MASTITNATLTVKVSENIRLNGQQLGSTNVTTVADINEVYKRIVSVGTTEQVLAMFGDNASAGTFIKNNVQYMRITNKDNAEFIYLVFQNEYNQEFCIKLDKLQSFIYNADTTSGFIDTMLANQVPLGFVESTGDTGADDDIENITANGAIIPGLRFDHDSESVPAGTSVGAITGTANGVAATTAHTLVSRHATTGAESVVNLSGTDTNGTSTYKAGFGDLIRVTAEANTGTIDLEVFIASK